MSTSQTTYLTVLPLSTYSFLANLRKKKSTQARVYSLTNLEGEWHELESKRERAKRRAKMAEESASQQK